MGSKNLRAGLDKSRESAPIIDPEIIRNDQKIDVEIRDIIRIKPADFEALKNSFEEWASKWD